MEDITDILAFEVKKEMADRYFGLRKRIEDDTAAYQRRLAKSSLDLENSIGYALLRLYILLGEERLINAFISLIGLPKRLFFDQYILDSPTIARRVFAGQTYRGLTWKRGFKHMFLDTYQQLVEAIEAYRHTLEELTDEHATIREEINLFYRNNDIDSIMGFIRRLDSPDSSVISTMQPDGNSTSEHNLSGQMRLHPPLPACEMLPTIPAIPQIKEIRRELNALITAASKRPNKLDLKALSALKPDQHD